MFVGGGGGGGRKKGGNLVVRGLCPRFVVHGGPNEYRFCFLCDGLSLPDVHIYVQIGLPCIYGYTDVRMDVVLQMWKYMYTTWDHGPALSGRQGSSLSLKHGLCVSASLNSLHTAPLKTGRGHSTCGKSPATRPWSRSCSYYKRAELYTRARNTCVVRLHASFRVHL